MGWEEVIYPLVRRLLVTVTRMVSPQSALMVGPGNPPVLSQCLSDSVGCLRDVPLMSIAFFLATPSPPTQLSCSVMTKLYCSSQTPLHSYQKPMGRTHVANNPRSRELSLIVRVDVEPSSPASSVGRRVTGRGPLAEHLALAPREQAEVREVQVNALSIASASGASGRRNAWDGPGEGDSEPGKEQADALGETHLGGVLMIQEGEKNRKEVGTRDEVRLESNRQAQAVVPGRLVLRTCVDDVEEKMSALYSCHLGESFTFTRWKMLFPSIRPFRVVGAEEHLPRPVRHIDISTCRHDHGRPVSRASIELSTCPWKEMSMSIVIQLELRQLVGELHCWRDGSNAMSLVPTCQPAPPCVHPSTGSGILSIVGSVATLGLSFR